MKMRKMTLFLAALILPAALFAGGQTAAGGSASPASTTPMGSFPVKTDVSLSYWLPLHVNVSPHYTNLGDTPFGKGLQERTGIKVNFLHPPANAAAEQLTLMIADGANLPDLIENDWQSYRGGPEKAISDGIILRLNDIIDKYCPNLKAWLKAHPDYDRMIKTDGGSYYTFPFIRDGEKLFYSQGLYLRKDWLDELGLQPPTTIDEWHTVLTAFKEKKNVHAPFTAPWGSNNRMFVDSFGVLKGFYISADDGKIHYGQIEPRYREWLQTMARWYKEGLLDPDIASVTTQQQNQKITSGAAGATLGSVGSGMGTWITTGRAGNPRYDLIAPGTPQRIKGEKVIYAIPNGAYGSGVGISAACKNVEIAARFLDYGYSQAGHIFYNFGIEGESYTMTNGKPAYTDRVMKNPQGWSVAQALGAYVRSTNLGPFIQDEGYIEQYLSLPQQKAALEKFIVPGATNYALPPTTATPEESQERSIIETDITTYAEEFITKVVLGTEALTDASWNNYVNTIKRMGIDRALALREAALARYKAR